MGNFQKSVLVMLAVLLISPGWVAFVGAQELLIDAKTLTEQDKTMIQEVILKQIEAFQRDDGETAFSLASPGIQQKFRTPEIFMWMVKTSYEPVYRPQKVDFLQLEMIEGSPVQFLRITGPHGRVYQAFYPMEFQPDKTWKTAGCVLLPTKSKSI